MGSPTTPQSISDPDHVLSPFVTLYYQVGEGYLKSSLTPPPFPSSSSTELELEVIAWVTAYHPCFSCCLLASTLYPGLAPRVSSSGVRQNFTIPPNLKGVLLSLCPNPFPWRCCLLVPLHCRETFCRFCHVPFLVAWSCPLPSFVSLWGRASQLFPNSPGFLLHSTGIPRYKRVLGSFVFLLWTLISFHSIEFPKKCTSSFLRLGTPFFWILWISPNSPISFSAHRWHSKHI